MMIHWSRFNIYLALGVALALVSGCNTEQRKRDKIVATLRIYAELERSPNIPSQEVSVFRSTPMKINVAKEPFLTEKFVKEVKVVNAVGGFALQLQLDRQGTWLLEQYSMANKGLHLAIFSQFDNPNEEKINEGRWLAAPKIPGRVTDGVIIFAPDATREEADQIALGLNNVAKKTGAADEKL
jgi:hypothetical protein